ncbi:MAG: adenine phosphoribosyltransferase [Candidatus Paceibacterota bacterium]
MDIKNLKEKIREIPDWPQKGVNFKDITPLLEDAGSFKSVIDKLAEFFKNKGVRKVVGIDARGFLLASAVAYELGAGVAIVRKKGKLPSETVVREYELEYGSNTIEMHKDAIKPGEKAIIIDDVLATGGTAKAAVDLVEELGGDIIGLGFLIDLAFLKGKEKLSGFDVYSLIEY